jgi:hypothetical protein
MSAEIIRFRDYERRDPDAVHRFRDEDAVIIVLPVRLGPHIFIDEDDPPRSSRKW